MSYHSSTLQSLKMMVESDGGNMIAIGRDKKAILVAMVTDTAEKLGEGVGSVL